MYYVQRYTLTLRSVRRYIFSYAIRNTLQTYVTCIIAVMMELADFRRDDDDGLIAYWFCPPITDSRLHSYRDFISLNVFVLYISAGEQRSGVRAPKRHAADQGRSISLSRAPESIFFNRFLFYFFSLLFRQTGPHLFRRDRFKYQACHLGVQRCHRIIIYRWRGRRARDGKSHIIYYLYYISRLLYIDINLITIL